MTSVLVLSKFKNIIDFEKYLKHVFSETKANASMKSSETHNMALGRMMSMSACVEARVFLSHVGNQVNIKTLKVIVGCLVELYNQQEFLQESISAVFTKLLNILKDQKNIGLQALEIIVDSLIINR